MGYNCSFVARPLTCIIIQNSVCVYTVPIVVYIYPQFPSPFPFTIYDKPSTLWWQLCSFSCVDTTAVFLWATVSGEQINTPRLLYYNLCVTYTNVCVHAGRGLGEKLMAVLKNLQGVCNSVYLKINKKNTKYLISHWHASWILALETESSTYMYTYMC